MGGAQQKAPLSIDRLGERRGPDAPGGEEERWGEESTYGNFEIDQLLRKRAHLVIKTKPVLPCLRSRKHEIPLPLLLVLHDDFLVRAHDAIIDIERAARLDLRRWVGKNPMQSVSSSRLRVTNKQSDTSNPAICLHIDYSEHPEWYMWGGRGALQNVQRNRKRSWRPFPPRRRRSRLSRSRLVGR